MKKKLLEDKLEVFMRRNCADTEDICGALLIVVGRERENCVQKPFPHSEIVVSLLDSVISHLESAAFDYYASTK